MWKLRTLRSGGEARCGRRRGDAGAGFRREISGASLGRAEQSRAEAEGFIVAGGEWGQVRSSRVGEASDALPIYPRRREDCLDRVHEP